MAGGEAHNGQARPAANGRPEASTSEPVLEQAKGPEQLHAAARPPHEQAAGGKAEDRGGERRTSVRQLRMNAWVVLDYFLYIPPF